MEQQDSDINEDDTDENELKELCEKIKEALENQGRDSCIVKCEENAVEAVGDNLRTADFDEETYEDHIEGCYDDFTLCTVDCVDYGREMRVNGVFIEDDKLKFYLQEYRQFDWGCVAYYDPLEVDFEGLMDGWWIEYADDYGYDPKTVLSHYLELITEKMPELLDSCFPRSLIFEKMGSDNQRHSSQNLQNRVSRCKFAACFFEENRINLAHSVFKLSRNETAKMLTYGSFCRLRSAFNADGHRAEEVFKHFRHKIDEKSCSIGHFAG